AGVHRLAAGRGGGQPAARLGGPEHGGARGHDLLPVDRPGSGAGTVRRHPDRARARLRGAVRGRADRLQGRARHHHLLRRGMGAVRPDARGHRLLRGARLRQRPRPAGGALAPAQGADDRHRGAGGAMMGSAATLARARALAARWYSIPLLLLLWQVAVGSGLVESRLLPGPERVWSALATQVGNGTLVYHASVPIARALTGFVLAALAGIPFAAAMARSPLIRNLFEPIFFVGYPVPKIALFPVFTYIFGIGTPSKIA